ncbi:unnamed protein product, partial [Iphiclides podalirius]
MQRANSGASEGSFWTTIELLADRGRRRSTGDYDDGATALELPPRTASASRSFLSQRRTRTACLKPPHASPERFVMNRVHL